MPINGGNLTAGINFIHKKDPQAAVFTLTIPLMVKADGTKFGKTAGGAIWLDAHKTSIFEFYQFWFNQDDRDVIKYLKYFTFLSHDEITQLENEVQTHPEKRQAQKLLAQEVTTFVHGASAAQAEQEISTILFEGDVTQLSVGQLEQAFTKMPAITISDQATNIVDWLVNNQLEPPKRQAHENISQGAIWINGQRIQDLNFWVDPHSNFASQYVLVRKGKKNYTLAQVQS